jgi:hypothetical protein
LSKIREDRWTPTAYALASLPRHSPLFPIVQDPDRDKTETNSLAKATHERSPHRAFRNVLGNGYAPAFGTRFWPKNRVRVRRGRRSKAEVEAERKELQQRVKREIDAIVAEMHELLPLGKAASIGAAYARYSSEFQHSIGDQVRGIFMGAIKLGIFIPRESVCFDLAVPGCKERRPGLDRLKVILKAKKAKTLLVFTINRLYRMLHKCVPFVQREVVGRGLRCIFLASNIDTANDKQWMLMLQYHGIMDGMLTISRTDRVLMFWTRFEQ